MAVYDIKIKVTTKKFLSIIIPYIFGIIVMRATFHLKGKHNIYMWAIGTPRGIRSGYL